MHQLHGSTASCCVFSAQADGSNGNVWVWEGDGVCLALQRWVECRRALVGCQGRSWLSSGTPGTACPLWGLSLIPGPAGSPPCWMWLWGVCGDRLCAVLCAPSPTSLLLHSACSDLCNPRASILVFLEGEISAGFILFKSDRDSAGTWNVCAFPWL